MKEFEKAVIKTLLNTKSKISIISVQDILLLDENYRMNIPGIAKGNWTYRMKKEELDKEVLKLF